MRSCAWILLFAATSAAWQPASTRNNLAATHRPAATRAPAVTAAVRVEKLPIVSSISQLVEFGRADPGGLLQTLVQQAKEDPSTLLQLVKDAGIAGAISYTVVELTFFAIALPIGYFSWHASTGEWLQPLLLLQEDGVEGKARLLGLLLSYVVLLKTLFPLRLGSTLLLTPVTQRALSGLPALGGLSQGGARGALKSELLELAEAARGGVVALGAEERARFDEIVAELRELNPTDAPASAATLTGAWECRWTSEKEINFAVEKGLFGEPLLFVGSSFAPDPEQPRRFNFAFESCAVRWRKYELPLPPVGKGWGELVYLDDDFRIQQDVRGDLLVATRIR